MHAESDISLCMVNAESVHNRTSHLGNEDIDAKGIDATLKPPNSSFIMPRMSAWRNRCATSSRIMEADAGGQAWTLAVCCQQTPWRTSSTGEVECVADNLV